MGIGKGIALQKRGFRMKESVVALRRTRKILGRYPFGRCGSQGRLLLLQRSRRPHANRVSRWANHSCRVTRCESWNHRQPR